MLKQRPKQFWGLLKGKQQEQTDLPLQEFTNFNKAIFYDADIPADTFTPLTQASAHHISPEELTGVLAKNFKANKSSGLSRMPLQMLKHLGPAGVKCMATFLNASAVDTLPPQAWRDTKVVPLYKGLGSTADPANYRSIAITPPFAKLYMAVINQRLTTQATKLDLHAPTQAGFREHHGTIEQALILQTLIQHSVMTKKPLCLAFIDLQRAYNSINREKLW